MLFERLKHSTDLRQWLKTLIPIPGSDKWLVANHSDYEWQVQQKQGKPEAQLVPTRPEMTLLPFSFKPRRIGDDYETEPGEHKAPSRMVVKVTNGWLIATDIGEWGGDIGWFSQDGTRHYKISKDQVQAFSKTEQGIFAVQGLSHRAFSQGSLIRLSQKIGRWNSEVVVDFKEKPYLLTAELGGSFLVVTESRLIRVKTDGRIETLIDRAFWQCLYPNSMAGSLQNGAIYIGMRHGVARVRKQGRTYQLDWLLPNKEFTKARNRLGHVIKGSANSVGI
ncbi:MAG: hypothetical protein V4671_23735 [Armatimonadota bacterium]